MAEQLQTIERESKRCGDLVKSLLTFSRQAPSQREPQDLNTVVHRAVQLVKHKLDLQNIELNENLADGLPPVECDGNQIQQVILVLMVNASEAMPKGGTLEVTTEFDPAGEQGVVRVKDYRLGHPGGRAAAHFRPVFHHQGRSEPHGPGPGGSGEHHRAARGRDHRPERTGQRDGVSGGAAGNGGGAGGCQAVSGLAQMEMGSNGRIKWQA